VRAISKNSWATVCSSCGAIRLFVVISLVCVATYGQVASWQELLASTDPEKRIRAVLAASNSGDAEAGEAVVKGLSDENAFVRAAARQGLRDQGKRGIEWLLLASDPLNSARRIQNANHLLDFLSGVDTNATNQFDAETMNKISAETSVLRCRDGICLERWMKPEYPPLAYSGAVAGQVWVTFAVDENGKPVDISAVGPPLIVTAAKDAIARWRFRGNGGQRGLTRQFVLVEFQLTDPSSYTREVVAEMILPNHVLVSAKRLR